MSERMALRGGSDYAGPLFSSRNDTISQPWYICQGQLFHPTPQRVHPVLFSPVLSPVPWAFDGLSRCPDGLSAYLLFSRYGK